MVKSTILIKRIPLELTQTKVLYTLEWSIVVEDIELSEITKKGLQLTMLRKIAEEDPALYMKAVTKDMHINYT